MTKEQKNEKTIPEQNKTINLRGIIADDLDVYISGEDIVGWLGHVLQQVDFIASRPQTDYRQQQELRGARYSLSSIRQNLQIKMDEYRLHLYVKH